MSRQYIAKLSHNQTAACQNNLSTDLIRLQRAK